MFCRTNDGDTASDSRPSSVRTYEMSNVWPIPIKGDTHSIEEVTCLLLHSRQQSENKRLGGRSEVVTERTIVLLEDVDKDRSDRCRRELEEGEKTG